MKKMVTLYIDQPFVGIFKINSNDLDMLEQIIKKEGIRKEISVLVNDILKSDFKVRYYCMKDAIQKTVSA